MSGVIDNNGVQWEHCNECTNYVRIDLLMYEQPSADHKYGRDLCKTCSERSKEKVVHGVPVTIDCQVIFNRSILAP